MRTKRTLAVLTSIACIAAAPAMSYAETGETDGKTLYEQGIQDYKYAAGEMKKYDEPLHLTFGRNMDLNAENWLKMAQQGEPIENNRWIQYYRDKLNIDCEYALTNANLGDYNQQILLAMASGELPDGENNQFADYFACELDSSLRKSTPV